VLRTSSRLMVDRSTQICLAHSTVKCNTQVLGVGENLASNGKDYIETIWGRGYVLREPQEGQGERFLPKPSRSLRAFCNKKPSSAMSQLARPSPPLRRMPRVFVDHMLRSAGARPRQSPNFGTKETIEAAPAHLSLGSCGWTFRFRPLRAGLRGEISIRPPRGSRGARILGRAGESELERFPLGLNREDSQRLVNKRVYPT
jgi:hypothetical protein